MSLRPPITVDQVRTALRRLPIPDRPAAERAASVALILRTGSAGLELLLIRRSHRVGDPWAGHMALPGGHWQAGDPYLLATAEREVWEEVGLALGVDRLLGELPCVRARAEGRETGLAIVPFVFHLTGEPRPTTSPEVDEVFWAELDGLAHRAQDTTLTLSMDGVPSQMPAWIVGGHPVWGLTYAIVNSLLRATRELGAAE